MTDEILIELDSRRRASLARLARPEHSRYLAITAADGTIILRPVDVVPAMPAAPAPPMVGQAPAPLAPAFTEPRPWTDKRIKDGLDRLRAATRRAAASHRTTEPRAPFEWPEPETGS